MEQTPYHQLTKTIEELLRTNDCWFETFTHEPVRTSEEAAKVRPGYSLEQGAKAIILRVKEPGKGKRFVMVVLPGDKRFDADKLKKQFNLTEPRFATEEEVSSITSGVLPGGVPPFGNFFHLDVFADEGIFAQEKIIFNAGDRCFSIGMYSTDWKKLVEPQVGGLAEGISI